MGGRFVRSVYTNTAEDLALTINEGLSKVEERADLVDIKLFTGERGRFYALLILEEKSKK